MPGASGTGVGMLSFYVKPHSKTCSTTERSIPRPCHETLQANAPGMKRRESMGSLLRKRRTADCWVGRWFIGDWRMAAWLWRAVRKKGFGWVCVAFKIEVQFCLEKKVLVETTAWSPPHHQKAHSSFFFSGRTSMLGLLQQELAEPLNGACNRSKVRLFWGCCILGRTCHLI